MASLRIPQSSAQPARDNSKNRDATGMWVPASDKNIIGLPRTVTLGTGMRIGGGVDGRAWIGSQLADSYLDTNLTAQALGISGNQARTVVAYFRPFGSSTGTNDGCVWGVGLGGTSLKDFALRQEFDAGGANGWRIQLWGGDLDVSLPNTAGTLRAVVVTHDGTTLKVYDSKSATPTVPVSTKTVTLDTVATEDFLIGKWTLGGGATRAFNGEIYFVETLSRAWGAAEVGDYFRNPGQLVDSAPQFPYAMLQAEAPAVQLTGAATIGTDLSGTGAIPEGTWTIVPGGEGGSMTFGSPTYLRYGADIRWAYKYQSGSVTFNNATFGDSAPSTAKNGYYFVESSGTVTLTGTSTIGGKTSSTGAVTTGASVTLTGSASTQQSSSGTSSIQIYVANAPEPVLPQAFGDWLASDSAIRCVLLEVVVQVAGVETTRYLSNKAFVTASADTPSNTAYNPIVVGGVQFTESLSLDGTPSLSYGDIELSNVNGERDSWLNDIWRNRAIKVYMGDVRWTRSQFVMIFNGVVHDVDTRTRDRLNLKLTDKLQRLNTPITENKLGGTSQNKDRVIPLCFGECFNVEPLLVNPALHEYQVHDGAIERVIEVRDNGVPVSFTEYVSTGKFRLNQSPVGQITCSVQGDKYLSYITNVGAIIDRIVRGYGNDTQRFSTTDIDNTKLTAFIAANPAPVGIYLSDRANVLEVCNQLAASVGARVAMSRSGLMYLVKIALPRGEAGTQVTASDMRERSLSITELPPVVASVKVGYAKNWMLQANIQTGIPSAHVAMFAQEWLTVTSTDSSVSTKYNLFTDPVMEETLLLKGTDATTECNRRLALYNIQRKVISYTGFPKLMLETLGSSQTITHGRFGLSGGQTGQIISVSTNWLNPGIEIGVLI